MTEEPSPTIAGMLWGDSAPQAAASLEIAEPETDAAEPPIDAAAVIEEHGRKIAKCEKEIGVHSATLEEHGKALDAPKPRASKPSAPKLQPDFSSFM